MEELTDELLREITDRLVAALKPSRIILFGSYAYGRPNAHSDVDIFVVVPDQDASTYELEVRAYRALAGMGVPKDIRVQTESQYTARAEELVSSLERVVRDKGRVLYAA